MKFGSQLRSQSVPEWRSYNIDYNELKLKIRIATDEEQYAVDESIKEDLYDSFIDQIDNVNLFLTTKMGEIKRRIIYVEELVESLDTNGAVMDIAESQLMKLSKDLQNLSRFIVIQKTALRKLLKKYTKYSKDQGALNTKVNKYMIKNHSSFIHLDLSGFYLELSLIYDLIREKKTHTETTAIPLFGEQPRQNSKRRSSHCNPIENLSKNDIFDFQSVKEGNYIENFLVHYDNLAELKLFLLANFFFIDDSTSNQLKNLQLMKQQSALSLKDILNKPFDPKKTKANQLENNDQVIEETNGSYISSADVYRSNSIYLNKEDPLTNSSFSTQILLDDPKQFQSIKNSTDPGYLITDLSNSNFNRASFLISAIGGLRKCSNVTLSSYDFTSNLLNSALDGVPYEKFYKDNEGIMSELDSLERISIEWLFTKHIKPVLKVKSIKTRFATENIQSAQAVDKSKVKAWISLSSNVEFSTDDMNTTEWTIENDLNSSKFPYAHLSIRYNSHQPLNSSDSKTPLDELFNSHLIYKIDNSFTLLTYSLFHYNKLPFKPTWYNLFTDSDSVDIRKLPPRPQHQKAKARQSFSSGGDSDATGHKPSVSSETTSTQLRYWNEFDHGSDYEDNDAGFLISVDGSEDDQDFQIFSDSTIENIYRMSFKISRFLNKFLPTIFDPIEDICSEPLNVHGGDVAGYGATGGDEESAAGSNDSTGDESDNESLFVATKYQEQRYRNDKFKLLLSLASCMLSDFLTFISMIATFSLFSREGLVIGVLVFSLLVSSMVIALFFASLSLVLLLNTEDLYRNVWQTGFVWTSFFVVCTFIILGLVRVFEV